MFCQECGTKNDDSAKFCESCGAKLVSNAENNDEAKAETNVNFNSNIEKVQENNTKLAKVSRKNKVIISVIAAIIIGLVVIHNIIKKNNSPEMIAQKYFEEVSEANWGNVYEYFDFSESKFINEEMYKEVVKKKEKIDVINYQIMDDKTDLLDDVSDSDNKNEDSIYENVSIQYAEKGSNNSKQIFTVKLVKQRKKKFFIYDDWKVVPNDIIVKDYKIKTLSGLEVTVDGIKLDKSFVKSESEEDTSYESDSKSAYVIYTIPDIFQGEHKVNVKGEFIEEHNATIKCNSYNSSIYTFTNPDIKSDFTKELEEQVRTVVNEIYSSAMLEKKFDDLKLGYEIALKGSEIIEDYNYDSMVKEYEDLVENMRKTTYFSNISIEEFEPTEIKLKEDNLKIENGAIKARYSFDMEYKATFKKKIGDKKDKKDDKGSTGGSVSFKYVDGKWYIVSMYMNSIYKYF